MAGEIPAALRDLIDDAALFPPGNAPLGAAVPAHRGYRQSWFAPLVGPLLVPQTRLADLDPGRSALRIGVIVDGDPEALPGALAALGPHVEVAHYESRHALDRLAPLTGKPVYAEIPLDDDALDAVRPTGFTPKFRTGGPDADSFPAPEALAAAIHGCRRRGMRFKLTAGLHRAVRAADPATGHVHHGFLNVLVAADAAADNAAVDEIAAILASEDAAALAARAKRLLDRPRVLWTGFGSCSVDEPLTDLTGLGLLRRPFRRQGDRE
ncbi:hypothetical protein GCM10009830_12840 [Glycomyces endophyticus]|uniref:Uncharacterized protein n=1 Tax=Glycomyces endophyticus TaxID=480996 RepID=A0ABN2GBD7_9ACTN